MAYREVDLQRAVDRKDVNLLNRYAQHKHLLGSDILCISNNSDSKGLCLRSKARIEVDPNIPDGESLCEYQRSIK